MYDAWQAQQKAQKDQERKAKTEAAAALQGYRKAGLSVEETKLADLKEQERLQKLNAEQQLRGYRSQLTEDEARLAAQRQEELRKKQEHEEQLRNNGVVSPNGKNSRGVVGNSGLVSALAAGYTSPNKLQPPLSKESSAPSKSTPVEASDNDHSTQEEAEAAATSTPTPVPVSPSSKAYKSSVKFKFGILTGVNDRTSFPQDRSKVVEGYLARADQIAKTVIADNNYSSSPFESILLSMAYPTASSVKKDESRTDTNRIMVTVTISFTAPDRATSSDFKSQVIERVRSAISAGEFTKLEQ